MPLSEADTRAKLIDPALHKQDWTEDLIRREETDRGIEIINGRPRRRQRGRIDYLLRVKVNITSQPVAVGLIEAKRSDDPPDEGLEQAKKYARLNHVPFVYSSNGHLFIEYDNFQGKTSEPRPLSEFPTPHELQRRYEQGIGISLSSETAKFFLVPYSGGEASRRYFGEPVYEYSLAQGIEDGYLPACEVIRRQTDLDERGVSRDDIEHLGAKDAVTGQPILSVDARELYEAPSFENLIQLPDRVKKWCRDLFEMFLQTGGPHQKAVVFCVRDTHADAVTAELNNLYADWCRKNGERRLDPYAFKCTASVGGSEYIADLRGSERSHFIATTVDLISTGVDVPIVRNVVFFRYVRSPISFQQMLGRGSRIHTPTNKLMFRVYDYTDATRLLGKDLTTRPAPTREEEPPGPRKERIIRVEGFNVHINPAGTYVVVEKEGKLTMVTVEEYREMLAERLVEEVATVDEFRDRWINPPRRDRLINSLPDDGRGIRLLQELTDRKEYDLYDVLAEIGYGLSPKKREERVESLRYKYDAWFRKMPSAAAATLTALALQFKRGGTEELENPYIFSAPEVVRAGGHQALSALGEPNEIILEMKKKLFAA